MLKLPVSLEGTSSGIKELNHACKALAIDPPTTILISGEEGTEKECIAQYIHSTIQGDHHPLISINCSLSTPSKVKAEIDTHIGPFFVQDEQSPSSATILLHKINRLQSSLQSHLAIHLQQILEEHNQTNRIHVIATKDRDQGLIRQLDQCFQGLRLRIPSLQERTEDIPLLLNILSNHYCKKQNQQDIRFSSACTEILSKYPWRQNTRELKKLIQYLVFHHSGKKIRVEELPIHFRCQTAVWQPWSNFHLEKSLANDTVDFRQLVDQFETDLIVQAMQRSSGNKTEAARLLNLKRTTLIEKIKKKGIIHLLSTVNKYSKR